jgi:16S rRNA (adenine1518-N6/adenine1519-N6)-dimethyltransferase
MSLLGTTKLLLRRFRIFPKRRLGQNFMVDASVFDRLADYASLSRDDVVLDVGAGLGFLTAFLAARCAGVVAVEADSVLVRVLQEQLAGVSNVKVIEGNVLNVAVPRFGKVVAIPPYQISSRFVVWLLHREFDVAVLVFQREFADRLVASVGSGDYGWLTVLAYYYVDVELLDDVPKAVFFPQPKVGSVVVRLKPKRPFPFMLRDGVFFERLVRSLFTQRNRKVRNAVQPFLHAAKLDVSVDSVPFCGRRVRELAPEDFGVLANALCG